MSLKVVDPKAVDVEVQRAVQWVLSIYSLVSQLATVGLRQVDITFELSWRAGWWQSICREVSQKPRRH